MVKRAMALPRFSCTVTSATVPPPILIGPEAALPAMNRKTRNIAVSVLKAHPKVKAR